MIRYFFTSSISTPCTLNCTSSELALEHMGTRTLSTCSHRPRSTSTRLRRYHIMNTDADSEDAALAHSHRHTACETPTIIDDESCRLLGARPWISEIPKTLHSTMNLPLRPALKHQADASVAHEDRNTKRARQSHDTDQARLGDAGMPGGVVARTLKPRMGVSDRDVFQSAPRSENHRRRITADGARKASAEPFPHTTSTRKRKAEDIGDRIDFLNFGYDELEPKTPEERLMKYRADVEISKLHAKRYKLKAEHYSQGFSADEVPRKMDGTQERIDFPNFGYDFEPRTPEEQLMKYEMEAESARFHAKRFKLREECQDKRLLAEGRARVAHLLADVEESRLKKKD